MAAMHAGYQLRCFNRGLVRQSPSRPVALRALRDEAAVATNSCATELVLRTLPTSAFLWFLSASSAFADTAEKIDFAKGGNADPKSYYAVLGLYLLSLPGLWSQIKRAPKAKIKRKTFQVDGPKAEGENVLSLDTRARNMFAYMKNYNYEVKSTGDVITFAGTYRSTRGQAAAITFYTFVGMLSTGLVLSIAAPFGGNYWYGLTLLTPLATIYYLNNGTRQEEFSIKMVTADDEKTTDIIVQGDDEEIERMRKELNLMEKDMVYVPGLLDALQKK